MASSDLEHITWQVSVPEGSVYQGRDQQECPDRGCDTRRPKRAKLLRAMCIISVVIVVVSVSAIVIGVLGFSSYAGGTKYVLCGGVLAGGMVLLFTICPFCMFHKEKTTKKGIAMGGQYKCCLYCMVIYFAFVLCAVLTVLGISGIWSTVECVRAKQKILLSYNMCKENTEARYIIAVLTLVTSSILLILILVIICIFCYNKKTLGYKDIYERNREFVEEIRREAREEALKEVADQDAYREAQLRQPDRSPGIGCRPANPNTPPRQYGDRHHEHRGAPASRRHGDQRPLEPRAPHSKRHGNRRPVYPSAPPLDKVNTEEPPPSYEKVVGDEPNKYKFEIGQESTDIDKP